MDFDHDLVRARDRIGDVGEPDMIRRSRHSRREQRLAWIILRG